MNDENEVMWTGFIASGTLTNTYDNTQIPPVPEPNDGGVEIPDSSYTNAFRTTATLQRVGTGNQYKISWSYAVATTSIKSETQQTDATTGALLFQPYPNNYTPLMEINSIGVGDNMSNDKGNIGIITEERIIENLEEDIKNLYKVANKLEQRISTLEKVLASHAKCIGEMREDKKDEI